MKNIGFLAVLVAFSMALVPPAQAGGKNVFDWIFTPDAPDFENRVLYDGKTPHIYTWSQDAWSPEGWTQFRGGNKRVIDDFYAAGIITDQYEDDGMPVLEVGRTFMQLSNQEKYRVAVYVDSIFGITGSSQGGFKIVHEERNTPVGFYTAHGLQLQ